MRDVQAAIAALTEIADDPQAYAEEWKGRRGGKVIGIFPMNFPAEIVHAAGALPVEVQAGRERDHGRAQPALRVLLRRTRAASPTRPRRSSSTSSTAFFLVDHCVALLGAVDAMRYELPEKPMFLAQYIASMDEPWTPPRSARRSSCCARELEDFTGATISDEALAKSIRAFNRNRRMLRAGLRSAPLGPARMITATQMQALVKSSMVMDIEEHNEMLAGVVEALAGGGDATAGLVRLHLSGHFCHAPRPELLDAIEECGGGRRRRRPLHRLPLHLDRRARGRRPDRRR